MTKVVKEIKHRWIWLAAVTAVGFLIDIGTKHLAVTRLEYLTPVNVIGEYLQWLLIYNTGAVFGLDPSALVPWLPRNILFITFMLAAIAFLLFYYKRLRKNEVLMHVGLMLVLPGAFGNLFDRIFRADQGVVDFIRMGIPPNTYWFIYNVADIFVTAGIVVMMLSFILEAKTAAVGVGGNVDVVVGDDGVVGGGGGVVDGGDDIVNDNDDVIDNNIVDDDTVVNNNAKSESV